MRLVELRQERGQLIKQMRDILDGAEKEKRNLSGEEQQEYGRLEARHDDAFKEIQRLERMEERERQIAEEEARQNEQRNRSQKDEDKGDQKPPSGRPIATPEYRAAYQSWVISGNQGLNPDEIRALSAGQGSEGGFLVMPEATSAAFLQALDDEVFIRGLATTEMVTDAQGLGIPSLDADPSDPDWTSELATGTEDTAMAFGKRELRPHPLAKRIKLSRKLLRLSPRAEGIVNDRLRYKHAIANEKAFLTGNGAQKPLGVFTASTDGISTSRDVAGSNTTTAIVADTLFDVKYSIKAGYWPRLTWIFHRDIMKDIRKLKDSQNQYLWQPGLQAGQPDRILDSPFRMSEFAPNTKAASQYVGIIGDFSFYWIVDALDIEIQRLNELYAETNQVGFISRMETDGMPVLEEAFSRMKMADS